MNKRLQIGIIGPEQKNLSKDNAKQILKIAYQMGKLVAQNKAVLITGGASGIMEAASKGAKEAGGITVGTPGRNRFTSNKFIDIEICTPIDVGDYIFAGLLSCDSIIVLPGDAGTLAELAIAYRYRKPLVFIKGYQENMLEKLFNSFDKNYPLYIASSSQEAVEMAIKSINSSLQ